MTTASASTTTLVSSEILLRQQTDNVLRLTLASPPANTLSEAMLAALQEALDAAGEDDSVKVIIIAAEGRIFSGGHDLHEMTARRADDDRGRAYFADILTRCANLMQTIVRHPCPVIAEVDGLATAAGCQLVASCDLAIASQNAAFCTPGVNIGLFCSTPMVALSRNMHRKQAMEMLLLGEMLPAHQARDYGLVNRVVPADQVMAEATKMAETIASKSPLTVAIGKEAFYRQLELDLGEAYDLAADAMVRNMLARDAEEGINAFIEKRTPTWEGR